MQLTRNWITPTEEVHFITYYLLYYYNIHPFPTFWLELWYYLRKLHKIWKRNKKGNLSTIGDAETDEHFWGQIYSVHQSIKVSHGSHYRFFTNSAHNKTLQNDLSSQRSSVMVGRGLSSAWVHAYLPQEHYPCSRPSSSQATAASWRLFLAHQGRLRHTLCPVKRRCSITSRSSKWNQSYRWVNCLKATGKLVFCFNLLALPSVCAAWSTG